VRNGEKQHPDTASVGLGYDAASHLGSLKLPIYETSTFVFETAEEGKRFFELAYGDDPDADAGYIYSRLARWEEAEDALIFTSGMGAITSVLLTFLRPGNQVVYSNPVYGGTATLMKGLLTEFGVDCVPFVEGDDPGELVDPGNLEMVYVETPANPTNALFDIEAAAKLAHANGARLVVDNTFLSPVWQRPIAHGADLSLHSATKYLGGHSDLTAGAVCGGKDDIAALRHTRYEIGTTPSPSTGWLLTRSLETLRLRVERQTENAVRIAEFLDSHPKVVRVRHLGLLQQGDPGHDIYERQCLGPGAMVSFEIDGGEIEVFRFLNAMSVVRLATSLGGTESLASHPWTMAPPTVPDDQKVAIGVTPGLVRLSVGIENISDLIGDLGQALTAV
jgi:methionine-gamma-lyase